MDKTNQWWLLAMAGTAVEEEDPNGSENCARCLDLDIGPLELLAQLKIDPVTSIGPLQCSTSPNRESHHPTPNAQRQTFEKVDKD